MADYRGSSGGWCILSGDEKSALGQFVVQNLDFGHELYTFTFKPGMIIVSPDLLCDYAVIVVCNNFCLGGS